jgi:hypothetical protein
LQACIFAKATLVENRAMRQFKMHAKLKQIKQPSIILLEALGPWHPP